jgi:hypothetical protein
LTEAILPDGAARYRPVEESDWVLAYQYPHFYRMRSDGGELHPIFADPEEAKLFNIMPQWIPEYGLMIFDNGTRRVAFEWETGLAGWEMAERQVVGAIPNESWLLLISENRQVVERMRPDGSEQATVAEFPTRAWSLGWAADGAWIYHLGGGDESVKGIWRMDCMTGEQQRLLAESVIDVRGFSPDRTHLAYAHFQADGTALYQLDVLDGTTTRLTKGYLENSLAAWGPDINRAWSPPLLILIGAGLSGIPLLPRKILGRVAH